MKNIFFGILCLLTFAVNAQKTSLDQKLSKHEFGVGFDTYNGSNYLPKLNYKYYRTEKNVLNFSTYFTYAGYYQAYQLEFWNEYRNYLGRKNNWFLSHGIAGSIAYSKIDYHYFTPGEIYEGISVGLGYNLGVGYKINDRFSIQAIVKPSINYIHSLQESKSSDWKLSSPLSFGVNYRF